MRKSTAIIFIKIFLATLIPSSGQTESIQGDCNVVTPSISVGGSTTISITCNNISRSDSTQLEKILGLVAATAGHSDDITSRLEIIEKLIRDSDSIIAQIQERQAAPRFEISSEQVTVCNLPQGVYWTDINCDDMIMINSVGGYVSKLNRVSKVMLFRVNLIAGETEYWGRSGEPPVTVLCPFDRKNSHFENQIVFPVKFINFEPGGDLEPGDWASRFLAGVLLLDAENEVRRASEIFAAMYEKRAGTYIDPHHVAACIRTETEMAVKILANNYSGVQGSHYIVPEIDVFNSSIREDGTEVFYISLRISHEKSTKNFFEGLMLEYKHALSIFEGPDFSNDRPSTFAEMLLLRSFNK